MGELMAAPIVLVEYHQLLQVAQRFQHKADGVSALRQQLQTTVSQLQHNWHGTAATAFFHEYQAEVEPAIERLREALETARDVAIAIHTGMRSAEEAAAALFRSNAAAIVVEVGAVGLGATISSVIGLRTAPPAPRVGAAKLPGGPVFDAAGNLIRFDLTLAEFEMLTAPERIQWVEALEAHADTPNWFHNIQDIIAFFDESAALGHMGPSTWASWADAGVLEAMQNGYQLHQSKGMMPPGFNDCAGAAQAWQQFFDREEAGADKTELLPLWATAEQRGVNYGSDAANLRAGIPAPGTSAGNLVPDFVAYGNTYRCIARMQGGGETFVTSYGPWVGQEIGTDVGRGVITPVANEVDRFVDSIFGSTPTSERIKDWGVELVVK